MSWSALVSADGRYTPSVELKRDLFSRVERGTWTDRSGQARAVVLRDWRRSPWWTRPLSSWLARREARALVALPADDALPALIARGRGGLVRSHVAGRPLHEARPADPSFYAAARRLLQRLHEAGVTHDDLAKEPNWIVGPHGAPGLVDFQLARVSPPRGRLARLLAREDLRHLLKHKRTYAGAHLTPTERRLLANPSGPARWLRRWVKPAYNTITRRVLGWQDREGQGPRP